MTKLILNFYKPNGKWYGSGTAETAHFLFEDGFKQDIINTQDALVDGWNSNEYFTVVVRNNPEDESLAFHDCLLTPDKLSGYVKETDE